MTITGEIDTPTPPPTITAPNSAQVEPSVASPLAGVSVGDSNDDVTVTVSLTDTHGALSANAGGGVISGDDSSALTLSGTVTQVNADLATLGDTDSVSGDDAVVINAVDSFGGQAAPATILVEAQALTVTIIPIDGYSVINYAIAHDFGGGVGVSGSVFGLPAGANFPVLVVDQSFNASYLATVNADGDVWNARIPEADASSLPNGTATVTAEASADVQASESVTVAEYLPTVTIAAVDGDNVINHADANATDGVALSGTVSGLAAGATFVVSLDYPTFSASYTATIDSNGTGWTATIPEADAITLPNGMATISAQVIDAYGNVSALATDTITVADTLPTVTIDRVNSYNFINYTEAHATSGVPLSGRITGLPAGATFAVSVDDGSFSASYMATVDSNATSWSATIPEADAIILPNGVATIRAEVTDAYGNVSAPATYSATVAVMSPETPPTVTIEPVDGDNVINYADAHAPAGVPLSGSVSGLAPGSAFTVFLQYGVLATGPVLQPFPTAMSGGTLTLSNGNFDPGEEFGATVNSTGTGWTATIPEADAIALTDGTPTISAQVTDANGDTSTEAYETVTVAETLPTVTIDPVDGDNVINYADAHAADGVALSGSVSGLAPGSTFTVSLQYGVRTTAPAPLPFSGGLTLTEPGRSTLQSFVATVNATGTGWTSMIPESDALMMADGLVTYSAQVTDAHGNTSADAIDEFTVAETLPTVSIAAVEDDDVINYAAADAANGVKLSGSISGLAAGATFSVSLADGSFSGSYTATVDSAGTGWTATIPEYDAAKFPDGTATVSTQVTDAYGNVSALATDQVTVAETLPTVTISAVEGDDVINYAAASSASGVPLSGTVTGLAAGATFQVLVDDGLFSASYAAAVDAAGTGWTADIPEADANTLPNGTATVSAKAADIYGNVSATATDDVTVAETPPAATINPVDGDNVINYAEANGAGGVPLSGSVVGLAAGATFSVLVVDGSFNETYTATVDTQGNGWTADIPEADAVALPNGTATISTEIKDAVDNATVAETLPALTISPVADNDVLNEAEASAAAGVALSGNSTGLAVGATFQLTLTDDGKTEDYLATVGAEGAWTATLPTANAKDLADGTATLSAQATDAYGNVSAPVTLSFTVAETGPTLTINQVEGDDVLTSAEASAAGGVTLSGTSTDLASGATFLVTVTDGGSHQYTATVGSGGAWTATLPTDDAIALAQGEATVTAEATDANGNMSAPATQSFSVQGEGAAQGDVHLTTFDGRRYDFQATGEFVLAASTNVARPFEVQVQESAWKNLTSVTTEIAAEIGDDALVFDLDGSVYLNGVLDSDATLNLEGGAFSRLPSGSDEIQWSTGETLLFEKDPTGFFDLTMWLPKADGADSVEGLLGENSGQADDYYLPGGTVITQPLSEDELTGFYADAWRVTDADTLFSGAAPAPSAAVAASTSVLSSGLGATRTDFTDGGNEVITTGIVGEPYDGSNDFYDARAHIETALFTKDGAAFEIENWNADGSVRNSDLFGQAGSPFGPSSAIDLEAFSAGASLAFQEDASGAFGRLSVSAPGQSLSLRLTGDYDAPAFSIASDGQGGAQINYHAV